MVFFLSENPQAIHLIEKHLEKLSSWHLLSKNPNAMSILKRYPEKIDWNTFSCNPSIFVYDYETMKQQHQALKEELIQTVWHPHRIMVKLEMGMDLEDL